MSGSESSSTQQFDVPPVDLEAFEAQFATGGDVSVAPALVISADDTSEFLYGASNALKFHEPETEEALTLAMSVEAPQRSGVACARIALVNGKHHAIGVPAMSPYVYQVFIRRSNGEEHELVAIPLVNFGSKLKNGGIVDLGARSALVHKYIFDSKRLSDGIQFKVVVAVDMSNDHKQLIFYKESNWVSPANRAR